MMTPDLALALLVNRTTQNYEQHTPAYIAYRETTHVAAPSLGRSQDIDRTVVVRTLDNVAVMNDIPGGAQEIGQAFPIIPFFDPLSQFRFSYYANLKRIDIDLERGSPLQFPIPPPNPDVDVVVPYTSFWSVTYAPNSTSDHLDLLIAPTPRAGNGFYPSEIVEDPQTQLPSHIELRDTASDMVIDLDFQIINGYWVITHGSFTATQHVVFATFKVTADITFDQFTFSETPPPQATALPAPSASASPSPSPSF